MRTDFRRSVGVNTVTQLMRLTFYEFNFHTPEIAMQEKNGNIFKSLLKVDTLKTPRKTAKQSGEAVRLSRQTYKVVKIVYQKYPRHPRE